uniref:Shisa family member 7 n=1 Tax=Nothobranchius furzeri TaxID=105023 RepID=A0A8C6PET7_NOTFU
TGGLASTKIFLLLLIRSSLFCRGYFDVMGHFDNPFNCTKDSYIYCCGTCQYRFCCEHQGQRLDQNSCTNYKSPIWAQTQVPVTLPPGNKWLHPLARLPPPRYTAYVIGGVISFTLVVAVGVRIVFSKVARRPRNRDINVPRSLVDILRHQSSPMQHGERNNATMLTTTTSDGRTSKSLYTPILQMKENRSKHNNSHPSFSHSFHNLAQLPPSYETVMKPEINRYSSLKKLGEPQGCEGVKGEDGGAGEGKMSGSGMFPTMGRLSHHQKAQSQQNICVTPSMDRHHMIKMNSHPTSGHEHERSSAAVPGMGIHSGWDSHGGHSGGGVGTTGGHPNARRMAFATKRQNTIEQLHFIPGGGGGQGLRTGSKNEVTV